MHSCHFRTLKRDPSLSKLIAKSKGRAAAEDIFAHLDRSMPRADAISPVESEGEGASQPDGGTTSEEAATDHTDRSANSNAAAADHAEQATTEDSHAAANGNSVAPSSKPTSFSETAAGVAPAPTQLRPSVAAPAGEGSHDDNGSPALDVVLAPSSSQSAEKGDGATTTEAATAPSDSNTPEAAQVDESSALPDGALTPGQACQADMKTCPVFHGAITKARADGRNACLLKQTVRWALRESSH